MRQANRRARLPRLLTALALGAALVACNPLDSLRQARGEGPALRPQQRPVEGAVRLDSDVEAPEIFRAEDEALWDGRPSLGGVWVAAPDVREPERVLMRNLDNGVTTIGALFRRERITPGPPLQLSSEAAVALGILAGAPTRIEVVALKEGEPQQAAAAAEAMPETAAPVDVKTP